jgi:8-amino-7-oxononanoate synthase
MELGAGMSGGRRPLERRLSDHLRAVEAQGLLRSIVPTQPLAGGLIEVDGRQHVNLSGNDYLGLGGDAALRRDFLGSLIQEGGSNSCAFGSGASRLMTGSSPDCQQLEERLAQLYGRESALVFNSGWQLNTGVLSALVRRDDFVLADRLCHASLLDGLRLTGAKVIRYPHLDCEKLEDLLKQHCGPAKNVFIVTESVFSMDGDCADLAALTDLSGKYGAVLYVDEAHAVGVRGECGLGLAEEQGVLDRIDLLVGTFGKAWAGQGAFIVCSRLVRDFLVNTARPWMFTTALPPVSLHWLNFILPKIVAMRRERWQLAGLAEQLRAKLHQLGLAAGGASQIIPVMIGGSIQAVAASERLRAQGWWVHAVRPPTVPPNTARLRISLSCGCSADQLDSLAEHIAAAARP